MRIVLCTAVLLAGCATIGDGTSQAIYVDTNPAGASCSLIREGQIIGSVAKTPGVVYVNKTKYDITISCGKAGYKQTRIVNKSGTAPAAYGNIFLGGVIGAGIDSATGADNKYDSKVYMTLQQ